MYYKTYKKKKVVLGFKSNRKNHDLKPKEMKFNPFKYKNYKLQKERKKSKTFAIRSKLIQEKIRAFIILLNSTFITNNHTHTFLGEIINMDIDTKIKNIQDEKASLIKSLYSKNIQSKVTISPKENINTETLSDKYISGFYFSIFSCNMRFSEIYSQISTDGNTEFVCRLFGKLLTAPSYDTLLRKICFVFFTYAENSFLSIVNSNNRFFTSGVHQNLDEKTIDLEFYNKQLLYLLYKKTGSKKAESYNELRCDSIHVTDSNILRDEIDVLKYSCLKLSSNWEIDALLRFCMKVKNIFEEYRFCEKQNINNQKKLILKLLATNDIRDKITAIFSFYDLIDKLSISSYATSITILDLQNPNLNCEIFDSGLYFQQELEYVINFLFVSLYKYPKGIIKSLSRIDVKVKPYFVSKNRSLYCLYREFLRLLDFVENFNKIKSSNNQIDYLKRLIYSAKAIQFLLEKYPSFEKIIKYP